MASVVNIDGDAQCIEKFLALQPKRTSLEIAALNGTDIPLLAVELRRFRYDDRIKRFSYLKELFSVALLKM
jgi:hypothetical protein